MDLQRRYNRQYDQDFKLEMRADENGGRGKLAGYFGVYNSRSVDMGGWFEVIKPGFFNRMKDDDAQVAALDGHVTHLIVASTMSGSLDIQLNAKGGFHTADPVDNTNGNNLLASVRRGDVNAMSFGFHLITEEVRRKGDEIIRELVDGNTVEISYTWCPAYPATAGTHVRQMAYMGVTDGELLARAMLAAKHEIPLIGDELKVLLDAREKLDLYLRKNGEDLEPNQAVPEIPASTVFDAISKRLKIAEIEISL